MRTDGPLLGNTEICAMWIPPAAVLRHPACPELPLDPRYLPLLVHAFESPQGCSPTPAAGTDLSLTLTHTNPSHTHRGTHHGSPGRPPDPVISSALSLDPLVPSEASSSDCLTHRNMPHACTPSPQTTSPTHWLVCPDKWPAIRCWHEHSLQLLAP